MPLQHHLPNVYTGKLVPRHPGFAVTGLNIIFPLIHYHLTAATQMQKRHSMVKLVVIHNIWVLIFPLPTEIDVHDSPTA